MIENFNQSRLAFFLELLIIIGIVRLVLASLSILKMKKFLKLYNISIKRKNIHYNLAFFDL